MSPFQRGQGEQPGETNLDAIHFEEDGSQRLLIVLVLDTSKSMSGEPIESLNEGMQRLVEYLERDKNLRSLTSVAVITFGHRDVTVWRGEQPLAPGTSPFVPVHELTLPQLLASGETPMVEAIQHAIYWVGKEKESLRSRGIQYHQPLVWVFSDGLPTDSRGQRSDDWKDLARSLRESESHKHLVFVTVSVSNISAEGDAILRALSPRGHVKLQDMDFGRVLRIVSSSVHSFDTVDGVYQSLEDFRQESTDH